MNFIKVLEQVDGLDKCGEIGVLERDGLLLTDSVAVSIDNTGPGTFLVVERVEVRKGVVSVAESGGRLLYYVTLPNEVSIEEISKMSAIDYISNLINLR
jgi:hypothetical protein